jgi:hypothetical protein
MVFARSMPAEGTAAKTAIAPRLLNEHLRSATHLSPCHDPARWPTIASFVHPSQISVALAPTLAKWVARGTGTRHADIRDAPLTFEVPHAAAWAAI